MVDVLVLTKGIDYKDLSNLARTDLEIKLIENTPKIDTWDRLFDINERYNDAIRGISKAFINRIKTRHVKFKKADPNWSYTDTLKDIMDGYEIDKYGDMNFLKISYMEEQKNHTWLIEIYG
jgi:hypothetical protein